MQSKLGKFNQLFIGKQISVFCLQNKNVKKCLYMILDKVTGDNG